MKFEHTKVFNFEGSFRGLRNPLESWNKLDSQYCHQIKDCSTCTAEGYCENHCYPQTDYIIGKNDLNLAQRMLKAGNDNSKFMREIMVSVDITAPLYWWKEYDTYKVGTVANSTSTMHKISTTPITKECFEFDSSNDYNEFFNTIQNKAINDCEKLRQFYLETNDKQYWRLLIQILPEAWLQKRTCTLNYAVLRNMYFARRNHKLTEWSVNFINWVNELPYAKELIEYE